MPSVRAGELVELTTAPTEAQAAIVQAVLRDGGVESWTRKASGFDYLGLGTLSGAITTVTVRSTDLERARAALEANRQDSVDIDWSEVDVGDGEDDELEPTCGPPAAPPTIGPARRIPIKAMGVWTVLIFLGLALTQTYVAPLIMIPIALIDLARRVRPIH